ncbi:unnamed protein product [Moneuplotes crassus]|uniref:Uncharacterized protein n=1 Tax=Euplotes crassus TaxID=5936 RepID=A0AAD1X6T9_EUPCR|nr:unnamed protein product [Moneuplotes crassus]
MSRSHSVDSKDINQKQLKIYKKKFDSDKFMKESIFGTPESDLEPNYLKSNSKESATKIRKFAREVINPNTKQIGFSSSKPASKSKLHKWTHSDLDSSSGTKSKLKVTGDFGQGQNHKGFESIQKQQEQGLNLISIVDVLNKPTLTTMKFSTYPKISLPVELRKCVEETRNFNQFDLKRNNSESKYCKRSEVVSSQERITKGDMAYILNLQSKLSKLKGRIVPIERPKMLLNIYKTFTKENMSKHKANKKNPSKNIFKDNMKDFVQNKLTKVQKKLFQTKFDQWKSPYCQIKDDQNILLKTMQSFKKKQKRSFSHKPRNRSRKANTTAERLSNASVLHPISLKSQHSQTFDKLKKPQTAQTATFSNFRTSSKNSRPLHPNLNPHINITTQTNPDPLTHH